MARLSFITYLSLNCPNKTASSFIYSAAHNGPSTLHFDRAGLIEIMTGQRISYYDYTFMPILTQNQLKGQIQPPEKPCTIPNVIPPHIYFAHRVKVRSLPAPHSLTWLPLGEVPFSQSIAGHELSLGAATSFDPENKSPFTSERSYQTASLVVTSEYEKMVCRLPS